MTRTTPPRVVLASVLFAVAVGLSGCAPQTADYGAELAGELQGEVLEVSQLAADADFDSALLALDELEVALKDARARGLLTEERYESILAATALVRSDLEAAIAAQKPPAPAPDPQPNDDDDDDDDKGDDEKGNKGKGNSDNKGKGNEGKGNEGKGNEGKGNEGKGKGTSDDD